MAGRLTGKRSASTCTEIGWTASRRKISRRLGSAIAAKTSCCMGGIRNESVTCIIGNDLVTSQAFSTSHRVLTTATYITDKIKSVSDQAVNHGKKEINQPQSAGESRRPALRE